MPPVASPRLVPDGRKLSNGHQTLITFARDTNIKFWEKTVTPPGVDGGDPVDQTTMHNIEWRTQLPRTLKELTDATTTVAYDPAVYPEIIELINIPDTITVTFPDGSTIAYYGYLRIFEPSEHAEGDQPEAVVTISPTMFDEENNVESGITLVSVVGT